MKVKWLPEAYDSLLEVTEYIRECNPKVAKQIITKIHQKTSNLKYTPYMAPISSKFPYYRELIITNYPFVIWYQVKESE
ncbi:type II toxin-antitoxin system RelE/ParE family toxin [Magnetococcales bacterium HHB-1]